jgi:hypothetical protein
LEKDNFYKFIRRFMHRAYTKLFVRRSAGRYTFTSASSEVRAFAALGDGKTSHGIPVEGSTSAA